MLPQPPGQAPSSEKSTPTPATGVVPLSTWYCSIDELLTITQGTLEFGIPFESEMIVSPPPEVPPLCQNVTSVLGNEICETSLQPTAFGLVLRRPVLPHWLAE